ncbi:15649_t:CDS:2 [Funneliformis geosporum]|uniref:15649_t:CDS:1 n=1 Tax=Funneliformis geosporum TaxID=1117311 RepID=A0A9W4SN84_9GLOM|nr:15649_t:CDS:2 [Funneliformis geosporum]
MDGENHQHIFNVHISSPRVILPLPPQTLKHQIFSLITSRSDGTGIDKRDLTFNEYVDDSDVDLEEAKRGKQGSRLIIEEINQMRAEYTKIS